MEQRKHRDSMTELWERLDFLIDSGNSFSCEKFQILFRRWSADKQSRVDVLFLSRHRTLSADSTSVFRFDIISWQATSKSQDAIIRNLLHVPVLLSEQFSGQFAFHAILHLNG
jgi:hypothetical protein